MNEITYYLVLVIPVNVPSLFSTTVVSTSDTATTIIVSTKY